MEKKSTDSQMGYDTVLAAGFRSKREQKKFAKLLSIANTYFTDGEWEEGVKEMTKEYCLQEAKRLKIPDGWQSNSSYDSLKWWFFQACR
jgi:hypothetical protein